MRPDSAMYRSGAAVPRSGGRCSSLLRHVKVGRRSRLLLFIAECWLLWHVRSGQVWAVQYCIGPGPGITCQFCSVDLR